MKFLEQLSFRLNQWIEYSVFLIGITMAVIVGVQVFSRYVMNHSLFWSEEIARYLLVWLTFLGATVAYRRQVHPGVDLFVSRLSDSVKRISLIAVHLISLALFCVMVVEGIRFAWFVRFQISAALSLPKWIILGIVPVSGILLVIHGLAFLIKSVKGGVGDA